MNRRSFLKISLTSAGALMVGCGSAAPWGGAAVPRAPSKPLEPNAWVRIHPDNRIEVAASKAEMGQGIHTTAAILVAEELEVPVSAISMVPVVGPAYFVNGGQITGGSTSTAELWTPLRTAGAAARIVLVQAAAKTWGVPVAECRAAKGRVHHDKGKTSFSYGELTAAAADVEPPEAPPLKRKSDYTIIGTAVDRVDLHAKVTGAPIFGMDATVDGMLIATLIPPPTFGSVATAVDAAEARKLPGIVDVFAFEYGVAVVAERYWQAQRAMPTVQVTWSKTAMDRFDSDATLALLRETAEGDGGVSVRADGDVEDALSAKGATVLAATYSGPFLAHAPMEPLNALAWVRGEQVDIWTGSQFQSGLQAAAADMVGIDRAAVKVHNCFLGGGFGRRGAIDAVLQALLISKRLQKPVKMIWSREVDTQSGYYRPQMVVHLKGALQGKRLTGLQAHCVSQSPIDFKNMTQYLAPGFMPLLTRRMMGRLGHQLFESGTVPNVIATEGIFNTAYEVPNLAVDYTPVRSDVPTLFWRSVGHSVNAFAIEGFIDELAHHAGVDALTFRREMITKDVRRTKVLDAVAKLGQWSAPLPTGRGRGIAVHKAFNTWVGMVSEASLQNGQVVVHKVACVVDCGQAVNTDQIVAQLESGVIYGLSAVLFGRIDLKAGRVQQSNFHDYRAVRLSESPEIVCDIIPSDAPPTGVGELGLPLVAPTVAAAIFQATGKRLRDMPFIDALKES